MELGLSVSLFVCLSDVCLPAWRPACLAAPAPLNCLNHFEYQIAVGFSMVARFKQGGLTMCRCVDRFDHHCPAICNCVGKGNQRAYTAWMAVLLLAQLLFLHLSCLFCARVARHHWNAAGQHDRGGFLDLLPSLWLVFKLHPGKVLLIVIEVMHLKGAIQMQDTYMRKCFSCVNSFCSI